MNFFKYCSLSIILTFFSLTAKAEIVQIDGYTVDVQRINNYFVVTPTLSYKKIIHLDSPFIPTLPDCHSISSSLISAYDFYKKTYPHDTPDEINGIRFDNNIHPPVMRQFSQYWDINNIAEQNIPDTVQRDLANKYKTTENYILINNIETVYKPNNFQINYLNNSLTTLLTDVPMPTNEDAAVYSPRFNFSETTNNIVTKGLDIACDIVQNNAYITFDANFSVDIPNTPAIAAENVWKIYLSFKNNTPATGVLFENYFVAGFRLGKAASSVLGNAASTDQNTLSILYDNIINQQDSYSAESYASFEQFNSKYISAQGTFSQTIPVHLEAHYNAQ